MGRMTRKRLELDQRKRLVLKGIVDQYIRTATPVSSQAILKHCGLKVSSATVRNDMQYLEREGYITKPYCSAGRVPTEKGYRFFVDWLLELSELTKHDQHAITEFYRFQRQELERLLHHTAFLLANLTGLVGFVLPPQLAETKLERVSLVRLGPKQVLVVLISDLGLVESRVLDLELTPMELEEIQDLLNENLQGRRFHEIIAETERFFALEAGTWIDPVVKNSFAILREMILGQTARRLHLEGLPHLMELILEAEKPDGEGVVRLLADERRLVEFLQGTAPEGEIRVLIGSENGLPELRSCSLVAMGYGYSGVLGVLGPLRMDYSKGVSVVKYIGSRLRTILTVAEREREEVRD